MDDTFDAACRRADAKTAAARAEKTIAELAGLNEFDYQQRRKDEARALGISVAALDKMVKGRRARASDEAATLPHWKVEPWAGDVAGDALLGSIKLVFDRYIVLPRGAGDALALWTLHAWTMDAGDVSPFLVLVSPTKRCGKTSVLILLLYLTPRSELASNISPSALFRYVEDVRPTLLIDEADTFVVENEELRGILNSGHTKAAAHVIRNVEINGEHKPRRFSTWAPKAIATIQKLADTLEDRAIVVSLQRKPRTAKVARLRKRDSDDFAILRRKAARWAEQNFETLADPDPAIPDELNDRAADNWRPLLAIADLAGRDWARRAREAARTLSGEGHESTSINVELLIDIKRAFGDEAVMRSADLVTALIADPERPWAEWKGGKPLTQKQLAGLLRPFGIISDTVHLVGRPPGKGYKRTHFEEAWAAYCPCQNPFPGPEAPSEADKRTSADEMGTSDDFRSGQKGSSSGSKNGKLAYSHAGLSACPDRKPGNGRGNEFDHESGGGQPCAQCGRTGNVNRCAVDGIDVYLHRDCEAAWLDCNFPDPPAEEGQAPAPAPPASDPWDIPDWLRRAPT